MKEAPWNDRILDMDDISIYWVHKMEETTRVEWGQAPQMNEMTGNGKGLGPTIGKGMEKMTQKNYIDRRQEEKLLEQPHYEKEYEKYFIENIEREQARQAQIARIAQQKRQRLEMEAAQQLARHRAARKKSAHVQMRRLVGGVAALLCIAVVCGGTIMTVQLINRDKTPPTSVSDGNQPSTGVQGSVPENTGITDPNPNTSSGGDGTNQSLAGPLVFTPVADQPVENPEFFSTGVFLGDSITEGLKLYDVMDGSTIIAEKGMGLTKVMNHLEEIKAANPQRLFILLGANDLADPVRDAERIATQYANIYAQLHEALPDCRIYVESMFPVWEEKYKQQYTSSDISNEKISQFNELLANKIEGQGVYFVDVAPSMRDENGELYHDMTTDGMHLKKAYYGYWLNVLQSNVLRLEEEM